MSSHDCSRGEWRPCFSFKLSSNLRRSFFCSSVRLTGVSTKMWQSMSPGARVRAHSAAPRPGSRNTLPLCVSGGTVILTLPPAGKGASTRPPSAATETETGMEICRWSPSRSNSGMRRDLHAQMKLVGDAADVQADGFVVLDAGRNLHRDGAGDSARAFAAAGAAGLAISLSASAAFVAGLLHCKKAAIDSDLSVSAAGAAGFHFRAGRAAGAAADIARRGLVNAQFFFCSRRWILQNLIAA